MLLLVTYLKEGLDNQFTAFSTKKQMKRSYELTLQIPSSSHWSAFPPGGRDRQEDQWPLKEKVLTSSLIPPFPKLYSYLL